MLEVAVVNELFNMFHIKKNGVRQRKINCIHLKLGAASEINEEKLKKYFSIASRGTDLEDSILLVRRESPYVKCFQCGYDSDIEFGKVSCGRCNSEMVNIIAEEGYYIEKIDCAN